MSRDFIMKSASDDSSERYSFDAIKTQGWLDGHASGFDVAVNFIRQKSSEAFLRKDDKQAIGLRNLADTLMNELRPQLVDRAKRHETEFPMIIEETDDTD